MKTAPALVTLLSLAAATAAISFESPRPVPLADLKLVAETTTPAEELAAATRNGNGNRNGIRSAIYPYGGQKTLAIQNPRRWQLLASGAHELVSAELR